VGRVSEPQKKHFVFPQWTNYLLPLAVIGVLGGAVYVPVLWTFGAAPDTINVGYQPDQPVDYSHAVHVGKLGIDCRYCHNTVDEAGFAAIPPTQTCINCHAPGYAVDEATGDFVRNPDTGAPEPLTGPDGQPLNYPGIRQNSTELIPVWISYKTGKPIPWVKVHDLADYAYFSHEAHVNNGVGCVSCHGRVDRMEVVYQAENLSMSWCLECHREPEKHLRPRDQVTNMTWSPLDDPRVQAMGITDPAVAQRELGSLLKLEYEIKDEHYMQACSTCHR